MNELAMEDDLKTCSDIGPPPVSIPAAAEERRLLRLSLSGATSFAQEHGEDAAAEISPPTPLRGLKREVTLEVERECKMVKLDDDDDVDLSLKNITPSKRRVKFCSSLSQLPQRSAKKAAPPRADLADALEQANHFSSLLDRIRAEKLKKMQDQQGQQGEQEALVGNQQHQPPPPQEPSRRRYQRRNSFVVHRKTGSSMGLSFNAASATQRFATAAAFTRSDGSGNEGSTLLGAMRRDTFGSSPAEETPSPTSSSS